MNDKPVSVIFGGSGFVGTHLAERLARQGEAFISFDIKEPRVRLPGQTYVVGDIRNLADFSPNQKIGKIYNFAAIHTTPGHATHEYYETNIAGAVEATKFAERFEVGNIIFTSSISVYGPSEEKKTEDSIPAPTSSYGYSKYLAEKIHTSWLDRNPGARLTVVRPAVVFGKGEGGNFTRLARLLRKGFFVYPGRKDTIKACIYVDDLLDAISFADSIERKFVLFNGAYPQRYTLEQIVDALISENFHGARTFLVPRRIVGGAASLLGAMGFLNIGIHPERVMKLVRSTDVYPKWLVDHGFNFPPNIESVIQRWKSDTSGTFI